MTCECIQSVIEYTRRVSYEIILVDNGSSECDPEKFAHEFPQITVVKSKINLGFAGGNNLGIRHAKGRVLLLLNSDVLLCEDAVSNCYSRLVKEDNVGVITCKLVYPDMTIQRQCHQLPSVRLSLIELLRIHKFWSSKKRSKILLNGYFAHDVEAYPERIWGTFFMFPQTLLQEFPQHILSETFFMYGEDTEWCYIITRMIRKKILYYPATMVIHRVGASNFTNKWSVIKKNREIFLHKYYNKKAAWMIALIDNISKTKRA